MSDKNKKQIAAKIQGDGCNCIMKNKKAKQNWCKFYTLTDLEKDNLFLRFYKLGEYNLQNTFMWGLITKMEYKRIYKKKKLKTKVGERYFILIL